MAIGNRLVFRVTADAPITNVTLTDVPGLTTSLAANQIAHCRFFLPFSVGAAGGLKFQIIIPAAPSNIVTGIYIFDTVTPAVISGQQTSSTSFANALAVAGTHLLCIETDVVNGANAGTLKLQTAQNSNNATPFTLLKGGWMEVTKL